MKKLFAFMVCLLANLSIFAQNNVENEINEIRNEYNRIHSELGNYEEIQYLLPDSLTSYTTDIHFIGYFNNGVMKLLIAEKKWNSGSQKDSYYFNNGHLFFVFGEYNFFGTETQERFYYHDNILIKALIKERNTSDSIEFSEIPNKLHPKFGNDNSQFAYNYNHTKEFINQYLDNFPDFDKGKKEKYMNIIKNERDEILNSKKDYRVEVAFHQGDHYWNNTNYTGYFDKSNNLRLLTFSINDEGYATDCQYFYNQGEVFYILNNQNVERMNETSEEQVFIYNGKVLSAYYKNKTIEDKTPFSEIKSVIKEDFPENIYRDDAKAERDLFFLTLEKIKNKK
jgi:hypothetical protein